MDLITPGYGLVFWQLSGLIYLGIWAYAIFDCVKSDFRDQNQKLIWVILIVFAPILGTLLYLMMSHSTKIKKSFLSNRNGTNKPNS